MYVFSKHSIFFGLCKVNVLHLNKLVEIWEYDSLILQYVECRPKIAKCLVRITDFLLFFFPIICCYLLEFEN